MSIAGAIRAGIAFIEIKAHDTEFQASMLKWQEKMVGVGASMRKLGSQVGIFAGLLGAPMVAGIRASQGFDDAIRGIQAAVSDLSPDQLEKIRKESLKMATELGMAPDKIAEQFLNLAKAGVSVEDALAGSARAAVMFAKVGKLEGGAAAELLADAMNVFKTSAADAGHTIAAAANASSVEINQMVQSFAMVGAVAGMSGQGIEDTSAALAVLGKNMLKGSDAGTSLKTMLLRLSAPIGEAKTAMAELGLTTSSFVDKNKKPLRLPEMVGVLNARLGKLNDLARKDILVRLFGQDAIRAAQILTTEGEQGINNMLRAMEDAVPLTQQFEHLMGGVSGFFHALEAGAKVVAIAYTDSLGPAVNKAGRAFLWFSGKVAWVLENVPGLGPLLTGVAVASAGLALALFGVAAGCALTNFFMNNLPLKVTTALAWAASAAFTALSRAAGLTAAAIYSIPGIGWIAGIVTALGALGAAAWWFYSTDTKAPAKGKGKGRPIDQMPSPADLQAGMVPPGAGRGGPGQSKPMLNGNEQAALSLGNVERLLGELIDVSKGQRPAFT
jgi:TP901 family phage tail tape measure protein